MKEIDRDNIFIDFEKLFWQLSRKMEYLWKRIYAETFPGSQSYIMFLLQQRGSKKMSELAHSLHLTAGAVTTAADHLIEQAYIARVRDENDRRIIRLELTEKGSETLIELQQEGRKIMKSVFNDVSDAEMDLMISIFRRGTVNIDKMEEF